MADSRDALPVTLEVVLVALAPQLSFNSSSSSGNATTSTARALDALGHRTPLFQPSSHLPLSPGGAVVFVDDASGQAATNGVGVPRGGDDAAAAAADLAEHAAMVSVSYIALFSTLFCLVGLVGMAGNVLVVYIVLKDKKMRKSVTNLLILNLAVADSLLMVFGVPEIVQFMLDRGWLLGMVACKVNRSVLVAALYASVLTLVAVCIER